ncbi:MAG: type II toxin-antitoxin system PemK/MazF family toxin [Clostridiales bacterium]|nr:type II toxin-antitoxin system PemK/MazF family toxin [Clostridiales bacterium]
MGTIQRGEVYRAGRRLVLVLQSEPEVIVMPVLCRGDPLDQIRTIDCDRLGRCLWRLNDTKMKETEQALHTCLGQYYEGRATA